MDQQLEKHRSLNISHSIPRKSHLRSKAEKVTALLAAIDAYSESAVDSNVVDVDVEAHAGSQACCEDENGGGDDDYGSDVETL